MSVLVFAHDSFHHTQSNIESKCHHSHSMLPLRQLHMCKMLLLFAGSCLFGDGIHTGLTEPFEAAIKDRVEELQKTLKQNDVEGWEGLLRTCIVAANFAVVKRQGGLADVTPSVEKARRESTKEAYSEACKSVVKALAKDEIVPETVVGEWKAALNNVAARN
eukprot:3425106-Amphidinium_carterae.1